MVSTANEIADFDQLTAKEQRLYRCKLIIRPRHRLCTPKISNIVQAVRAAKGQDTVSTQYRG